jgi:hypothetical protein
MHPFRRSIPLQTLAVAASVAAAAMVPLLVNRYFFYADDDQSYFMPVFGEIARLLEAGVFPWFTERSWYGGAILDEYQFGILNPASLLLLLIAHRFADLAQAAAFYAISHYAIYAGGTYLLGVSLGFGRRAAITGTVIAVSSSWLMYWGATSYIPGLVSIAWVPWSLSALIAVYRDRRWFPLAGLATALSLSSGWPFTTFSLPLLVLIGLATAAGSGYTLRRLAGVALAALLGAGLAMPAILPTSAYLAEATREASNIWRGSLEGVLSFGFPSFAQQWVTWDGSVKLVPTPFFYVAWFCPILLAHARWRPIASWQERVLVGVTLVFGLLCLAPAFWQLRWSFRFLPYFDLGLALLTAWIIDTQGQRQWEIGRTTLVVGLSFLLALFNSPELAKIHLLFLGMIFLLVMLVFQAQRQGRSIQLILLGGQALIFVVMLRIYPANDAIPHWHPPTARPPETLSPPRELALFAPLDLQDHGPDYWSEIPVGNRGLDQGRATINGYSPMLPQGLRQAFCFDHIGAACPELPAKLFEVDAKSGLDLIDLVRVERVTAERGPFADRFRAVAGARWIVEQTGKAAQVFGRAAPLPAEPGSVGWSSSGIALSLTSAAPRREVYQLTTAPGFAGGDILLARAWYPGMYARLDGKEITLVPYRHFLPDIILPAGAQGQLVFGYWPTGLGKGLILAAVSGAALILLGLLVWGRRSYGPSRQDDLY